MNAVIYMRVSTVEQAEKNKSLDMQEKACKDYAAGLDIDVDVAFREEGESAKTADRTRLKELLQYCSDHRTEISHVIVWKLDRLARRTEDHIAIVNLLMKYGIRLHSATEPIEETPSGRLMEHILASFAEFDNNVRAERSKKGMLARLQESGWVHMAPIGYTNVRYSLGRPTVMPDEMSKPVQRLLRDFSKNKVAVASVAAAAAQKYMIKAKNGKPIASSTVYALLRNPLYAGLITGKGIAEPIAGLHEPLITMAEHRNIIAILEGKKPDDPKPMGKKKFQWPLRRFLRCGYCNNLLTGSTSRGRSASYDYYHCTKCKGASGKHLRLPRIELQESFVSLLQSLQPSPGALRLFKELVIRKWNADYAETIAERSRIEH